MKGDRIGVSTQRDLAGANPSGMPPRQYGAAVAALAAAQKPGAGVPAYLRWVNRGLGRRAAAVAYVVGLTPNQVTAISAALSLAGMAVLATGSAVVATALISAVLLLAGYALDSADGQLARLSRSGSAAGEWLDHVVDAIRLPAFHIAVAVLLYRTFPGDIPWEALCAIAFALLSSAWFFAQILFDKIAGSPVDAPGAASPAWVSFVKLPYDVGFSYLILLLIAVPRVFLVVYLALFAVTCVVAGGSMLRKYSALAGDTRA